jgi:hypothetical protein
MGRAPSRHSRIEPEVRGEEYRHRIVMGESLFCLITSSCFAIPIFLNSFLSSCRTGNCSLKCRTSTWPPKRRPMSPSWKEYRSSTQGPPMALPTCTAALCTRHPSDKEPYPPQGTRLILSCLFEYLWRQHTSRSTGSREGWPC